MGGHDVTYLCVACGDRSLAPGHACPLLVEPVEDREPEPPACACGPRGEWEPCRCVRCWVFTPGPVTSCACVVKSDLTIREL